MSEPEQAAPPVQRFVLNARPPVRPLAIGAGAVVLGAVLLVWWGAADLPAAVAVLAGLLMVLGIALATAGIVIAARLRTEVLLDADSVTVLRRGQRRSLPWSEVKQVTAAHPRLTLVAADGARSLSVVNPRTPGDPRFADLSHQLRQRLDSDRGYRSLE